MGNNIDHATRLEEILAEWNLDEGKDVDTYSINLGGVYSNVSLTSPYTIGSGINLPNAVYTTTGTASSPWTYSSPNTASPKIQLDGENADITVNGWSLVAAVKSIEERLGLYQPNPELEVEWKELRELGEQYRKLEQHIKDKQATWNRLKAMPAPEVD
jgi:hypothetical protein